MLVVFGFNATLTAKVISRRSMAHVFPGFLSPVLTQLFFPKPPTTFPTCFCRGERRKYAGKKSRLNRGSNLQPPGHESDALTTEPPGRGMSDQTTSLGQIVEKHCVCPRGHIFSLITVKLILNFVLMKSRTNTEMSHVGSKTRPLGHIFDKPCVCSRN